MVTAIFRVKELLKPNLPGRIRHPISHGTTLLRLVGPSYLVWRTEQGTRSLALSRPLQQLCFWPDRPRAMGDREIVNFTSFDDGLLPKFQGPIALGILKLKYELFYGLRIWSALGCVNTPSRPRRSTQPTVVEYVNNSVKNSKGFVKSYCGISPSRWVILQPGKKKIARGTSRIMFYQTLRRSY